PGRSGPRVGAGLNRQRSPGGLDRARALQLHRVRLQEQRARSQPTAVKRAPGREWLDDPGLPGDAMAANLADIAKVDRLWGGARALARWLLARGLRDGGRRARILDLGAGSAAVSRRLRAALADAGVGADVFALALQWRHLRAGSAGGAGPIPQMAADALRLPLADASVDWAVSTLFLHHFSPEGLGALFAEMRRVARR